MIFWPPSNNRWQSFVCILYLLDKIYHYIKIIPMISCIAIILLFRHYQKLFQLDRGVKISYVILTRPLDIFTPQWIDDKVLFAFHIYLIRSLYWNYINDFLNSYNAFVWHYQELSQLDPGVKISHDILTPPLDIFPHLPPLPPNNRWKTVVCISCLLD